MKILLINTNPVVSRLLALCTRDEHMGLDEVKSVDAVEKEGYDIVFVDEASYAAKLSSLFEGLQIRKKVFLSYTADPMRGFDITVKKPFLPSQIIRILSEAGAFGVLDDVLEESLGEKSQADENQLHTPSIVSQELLEDEISLMTDPFSEGEEETAGYDEEGREVSGAKVLNMDEIAKIKALLDMEEDEVEIDEEALLEDEDYEARKIKAIKEQLIAEGLEILEEDEMVEELSASVEEASERLEKKLKKIKMRHEKKRVLSEEERSDLEKALHAAIANLKPKKIKKLLNGEEIKVKIKLEDHL